MNKRINTKEQRHYSIRKVSGKAVSVFIGATIFSIALGAGVPVSEVHAATDSAAVTASSTTNSQKTSETSSNADLNESSESASNSAATSNSSTSSSDKASSVNDESSTSSSASADDSSASTSNKTSEVTNESSTSSSDSAANSESSTSSSASADDSSASTSNKTSETTNESSTSSSATAANSESSAEVSGSKTKQAEVSAVNKPLIRTPDTYAPSASVALPTDYPSEFNTDQYKDYYVFKGIYDAESGTTYYGAVMNDGSQAGTLYIFSEKNGQISGPLEVEKGKQQVDGNVTLYNYGDTYTVALPVGHNDLNYAYSSDGEKINENTKNNQDSITGVIPTLNTATVTVNYLKQDGSQARTPYTTTVTGLAGKAIHMDDPAVVPGYVLVAENSEGTISEYTPDKVGQTWTRHFSTDDFGNNIYATYTLKNAQGDFEVKVYENDKLVGTYNLGASKSASYTDPSTGYIYSFPNPYDSDTANVYLTYQEVGNIVPVDKDGKQIGDKLPYNNDYNDPSKVTSKELSVFVNNYRLAPAEDQTSKDVTIKKVNDYNTGAVTPSDPTKDTEVVYIKDDTATIKVIYADISSITKDSLNDAGDLNDWLGSDQSGVKILKTDSVTGKRGTVSDYTTASEIAVLAKQGYKVVQVKTDGKLVDFDEYTPANDGTIFGIDYSDETNSSGSSVKVATPPRSSGMVDGRSVYYVLLYKSGMSATQKITYRYADGSQPDSTAVSTVDNALTRTLVLNEVSTDGPSLIFEPESSWTTYNFKDVLTPTVENYTPDKTSAGAGTATYENPVVEDLVIYTRKDGALTVKYVDQDNDNAVLETKDLSGKYGDKITYTTADTIKSLEAKGYELVSDGYTGKAGSEISDSNNGKTYLVVLKHGTTTITPDNPKDPNTPINPNDPDSPKYTDDQTKVKVPSTQTITYTGAGDKTPAKDVQTGEFDRTVTVDNVTGKTISSTPWTYTINGKIETGEELTYSTIDTPVIDGYHADKKVAGGLTATVDNPNVEDTVTYAANGKIVPVDPDGNKIPDVPIPTYPTDPNDPTKVTPDEPVPDIPGYTPEVPTVTPENPGKDTQVVYNKKDGSLAVKYVDQDSNNAVLETKDLSGKYGDKITYTTADTIKSLEDKGYELVSDGYTGKAGSEIGDSNNGKTYLVVFKHGTTTVTPDNPKDPNTPINPNDPNGPKYTEDQTDVTRDASQTVHYTGAGDNTPSDNVQTQKNAFTRTVTVDKVTGKTISTTPWTGSKTFGNVSVPVVNGYHSDKKVAGGLTATPENPNVTDTVTYTTNGKIIPVDPNGNKIPDAPTPTYPTDPNDPTKVTPDEPVPDIPGYTPSTPTVTPENPGKDTTVVYTKKPGKETDNVTPEKPSKPSTPSTPSKPNTGKTVENVTPKTPETPNKSKKTVVKEVSDVKAEPAKQVAQTNNNSSELPQTGENEKTAWSVAGVLLAGAAFLFGLADTRKRKRH